MHIQCIVILVTVESYEYKKIITTTNYFITEQQKWQENKLK